jgi:hypothetical protein
MAASRIYDWGHISTVSRLTYQDIAKAVGQIPGIVEKWLDSQPIQEAREQATQWQTKNKQRAFPHLKNVSLAVYESTPTEHLKTWIEHCDATADACRPLLGLAADDEILDEDLKAMARIIEIAVNRPAVPGAKPPPVTPKPRNGPKRAPVKGSATGAATGGKTSGRSTPTTPRITARPGEHCHPELCNLFSDADCP